MQTRFILISLSDAVETPVSVNDPKGPTPLLEPFQLPFVQRGLIEVLILAVPTGLLGTWIVLRGLAFFSHAVGTATFPGLVLADGLGFAAPLGAFAAAVAFAAGAAGLRGRRTGQDAVVALVLVGCLASGVILASDVFGSGSNIETLLFGSLLLVDGGDLVLASVAAAATLLASVLIGQHWLRAGFDPTLSDVADPSARLFDAALLGLVALAMVAALTVVGALLVAALFVVPAVTARLLTDRLLKWQLLSVGLVALEGTVGLWLSVKTNAPPGATIACVAGAGFAAVAVARALARVPRGAMIAAALGALVLLAAGCGGESSGEGRQVKVVATTTQAADFVREVGGKAVEVTQILQPNSDPHDYEPRPSDVEAVADAELVFVSGRGLDDWAEELVADSGGDAQIVDLGAMGPIRLEGEGHEHEHEEEGHAEEASHEEEHSGEVGHEHEHEDESELDPHWWHDPRNVEAAIPGIENVLVVADPSRKAEFIRNADDYVAEVKALDAGIAACIDSVPASQRKLVTDHDAFGYFANRYGIEVVGAVIPSQTTQAQPSAKDLSELAETIEAEDVKAVFPESSLGADVVEAIAEQTGASAEYTLYGDTLGPEGSDGETYLGMEEANADAVVRGFTDGRRGCKVSP
jgi:ABC-type Zn uptake system ZnuABC Zn-binding protein ZnuA/ABC-type Mn2+/Zn2+ transport system permease subunit